MPSDTKRTATALIRLAISEVEVEDKSSRPVRVAPAECI